MDEDLNFSSQVEAVVSKANRLLGMIRRAFVYMDEIIFLFLYKGLIRPILEYGVVIWNPQKKSSIHSLESVQRRATKLVPKLKDRTYPERLRVLNLPSLTFRRVRGDVIETFKYLNDYYDINKDCLFSIGSDPRTRGHSLRLVKTRCRTPIRAHFLTQRIVNVWNKLPEEIVTAPSLNTLKARLDRLWDNHPAKFDYTAEF